MKTLLKSVLVLATLTLAACGGQTPPRAPGPDEVVVAPATRVLEAEARTALQRVDEAGTLYFAASSAQARALEAGHVLVSEPAPAIPYGLLRKVKTVRREGDLIVVETEPARIQDAVYQGTLEVSRPLRPEDVRGAVALQSGVSAQAFRLTLDSDLGSGGRVRVTGEVSIEPILDFYLGLHVDEWFGPIPVNIDLNARTRVGIDQRARLNFTGSLAHTFRHEVAIARYDFAPIVFFLGPVPVVLTPKLTVYLGTDGNLSARFTFEARQELRLVVGFEYNSDTGFRDLSERTLRLSTDRPTFEGSVEVRGFVGVRFEVLIYGLVGPFGALEAGPEFSANLSGMGPSRLLWDLNACLWLKVGIRSIDILGIRYDRELFRACLDIAQYGNNPPSAHIVSPLSSTLAYQGVALALRGSVTDPDPGHRERLACRWTSSNAADFPLGSLNGCEPSHAFTSTGRRTLTLTTTDPAGASASARVEINVQERPALLAQITSPAEGSSWYPGTSAQSLRGTITGGTAPYRYTWRAVYPYPGGTSHTLFSGSSDSRTLPSHTWRPDATLPTPSCSGNWNGRLYLEVTDDLGTSHTTFINFSYGTLC